jgi:hypothetical protein
MRKKKVAVKAHDVYNDNIVRVSREQNEYFFEIGKELTTDVAEAVSMLMRQKEMWNSPLWDLEIEDISYQDISPEKSLFWLTGGYSEWRTLEHYNKPWCDCYLDFQEEFGILIVNIVKRSKKLKDIRNNFIKYLGLPVLYDFAIKNDMTK